MSHKVMIIGAGGVGSVVTHKCAQHSDIFGEIVLTSRTVAKCDAIASSVKDRLGVRVGTAAIDADDTAALTRLLEAERPEVVINVALPYQDLSIMEACLAAGVHYLDTANYEPRDTPKFEYHWQWAYRERFEAAGLMALLGCGFDPGVTNIFTAYLAKHYFDRLEQLDIVDVNGGDHGQAFATNFNPEINIREVTAPCRHWEGEFVETPPMSLHQPFACPDDVGTYEIYRMYHEELESLAANFPTLKRAQFWMSFSENYLTHLRVLQNVGMTRIDPVLYNGVEVVPLQFLKAVLPEPASLGPLTKGRTCIGVIGQGQRCGAAEPAPVYVYNVCSHEAAFKETGSQAISYTTGVPAMIGARLMLEGVWSKPGVWNTEQFDPDPFMDQLNQCGLPWQVQDPAQVRV